MGNHNKRVSDKELEDAIAHHDEVLAKAAQKANKGNGKHPLTAADLPALREFAQRHGLDPSDFVETTPSQSPQGKAQRARPPVRLAPESADKLINAVCEPSDERAPELTDLNPIMAHVFPCSMVFEALCDPKETRSPYEVFRQAVYSHRRSRDRWFASNVLALAGYAAQAEEIERQTKVGSMPI